MDRHEPPPDGRPIAPEEINAIHEQDIAMQGKYGVRYITAIIDPDRRTVFCIVEAPDRGSAEAVHQEAHGNMASNVIAIDPALVDTFVGGLSDLETGELKPLRFESALRTILFTDMVDSTEVYARLGDRKAVEVKRAHDEIVRGALTDHAGRQVKHTGDGVMACANSVVKAVEAAAAIQRGIRRFNESAEIPIHVRIGLAAGEPVTEGDDLFGAAVTMAARICAVSGSDQILASSAVKELALGKGYRWADAGEFPLKGFEETVRLFSLNWAE